MVLYKNKKPYERTKIVDYILDEENESVDLIHEVTDDEFFEKIKNGDIQYVSAMVWPATGGYEMHGTGRAGLPIIDAYHWKFVHHAFLKDNPAYGKDTAQVKTTCEGENCQVQLLSAKAFAAVTTSAPGVSLDPLKEIPLLYRHKKKLHLVSASSCVQDIIQKKKDAGHTIDDKELAIAYSECGESNKANISFKSCTCAKTKLDEEEHKEMQSKLKAAQEEKKELESKLKAQQEEKEKEISAKKARYSKLFAQTDEDEGKKMYAKLKAATDDPDELKAMDEEYDNHTKARKAQYEDPEKKELQASNKAMAAQLSAPMIATLVAIRKDRMPEAELTEFENALKAKSFVEIQTVYENESYVINALKSKNITTRPDYSHFDFNGSDDSDSLSAKSLEEITGDAS